MLSNIIFRSTAAFGGAPFRLKKCTALTSAATGAAGGSAAGGVLVQQLMRFHDLNKTQIQFSDYLFK